jgi:hypothetical protein
MVRIQTPHKTPPLQKQIPPQKNYYKNSVKLNFTNNPKKRHIGRREIGLVSHAGIGFAGFLENVLTD